MSLDERIRHLARMDVQGLQQQITDLHEHLHQAMTVISRLDARIDALEKAAGQTDQEQRPTARRAARPGANAGRAT